MTLALLIIKEDVFFIHVDDTARIAYSPSLRIHDARSNQFGLETKFAIEMFCYGPFG